MRRRPWWWLSEDVDDVRVDIQQDEELFLVASQTVEQDELRESIESTMQSLGSTDQEVLRLRYFDELDYQSIADRLGIGLSAVKMRIKRAREAFVQSYNKME